MELFSPEFFSALAAIVVIDLVLAGDNAVVIALAARNLPPHLRNRAIAWGTVGAVAVRSCMTVFVVWLLKIPGLLLLGGLMLTWIAYKLLNAGDGDEDDGVSPAMSFWAALKTIVIADAVMGLDNVLGVAGAAHGNFVLVVLGLLISIPIVIWGSKFILKLVERFPAVIYAGAGVLAWTSASMVVQEPLVAEFLANAPAARVAIYGLIMTLVLAGGYWSNRRGRARAQTV